jgi:hypothetical protein
MSAVRLVPGSIEWPGTYQQVIPYLQAALDKGGDQDWTIYQVVENLAQHRWWLYGVLVEDNIVGAGVVCVQVLGVRRVLEVVLFGCDSQANVYQDALNCLKSIAKSMGCTAIRCEGRKGWKKALNAKRINTIEIEV